MVIVAFDESFKKLFSKIKNNQIKEKLFKQIEKLKDNPEAGKPMRFGRKGTRELYIHPYRLSYAYLKEEDKIILLDLYTKDEQ
ncbi:type II toxin-antitoxin system RelE/ParE family toxin [Candidatus Woesearchaeota archaeon]|nr:type II toxin-antitoxin system RelE/ParE family toxin [Candidatus Woesearchaeota archaeon]